MFNIRFLQAFNEKFDDEDQPKTMWRITSNDDIGKLGRRDGNLFHLLIDFIIVATGLPERGNQKVYPKLKPGQPYPRSMFSLFLFTTVNSLMQFLSRPVANNFDFAHLGTEIVMYDHPHSFVSSSSCRSVSHSLKSLAMQVRR